MPWCNGCDRYLTPNSLDDGGRCPTCGEEAETQPGEAKAGPDGPDRVPWHFWLVVAALAIYLGWRLVQGIAWLL